MLAETNETKQKVIFNTVLSSVDSQRNIFCLDSGATSHMCFNEHLFTEINPIDDTYVTLAVDKTVKAIAKGTVTFDVLFGNQTKGITLQNVLYIPELKNNLISISKVTANNFTVKVQRNHASVINSINETVLIAKREKVLYYVTAMVESVSIVKEIEQWHQKFSHLNEKDLKKLQAQNMVYGMNLKPNDTLTDCKVCICDGVCTINVDAPRAPGRSTKIFTGKPGRPRKQYNINEKIEEAQIALEDDAPSLKEALNGLNPEEWLEAMQTEYNALLKNQSWRLVKQPKDKNIIGSKWVLRTKYNADGSIALRKARLVAKGFAQIPDVDYQETFAPVARPGSIRTVMAYCAENNLEIFQLDFIMAYVK
ncbi:Copia protein [Araneus ventricosus]|uniref:Copia protein n=1 Tax=Araneus ventricosus TaxID=182803 RepID=A0A4Y2J368_ARAVE|nr:Copia protein [Araneus ventricosus]